MDNGGEQSEAASNDVFHGAQDAFQSGHRTNQALQPNHFRPTQQLNAFMDIITIENRLRTSSFTNIGEVYRSQPGASGPIRIREGRRDYGVSPSINIHPYVRPTASDSNQYFTAQDTHFGQAQMNQSAVYFSSPMQGNAMQPGMAVGNSMHASSSDYPEMGVGNPTLASSSNYPGMGVGNAMPNSSNDPGMAVGNPVLANSSNDLRMGVGNPMPSSNNYLGMRVGNPMLASSSNYPAMGAENPMPSSSHHSGMGVGNPTLASSSNYPGMGAENPMPISSHHSGMGVGNPMLASSSNYPGMGVGNPMPSSSRHLGMGVENPMHSNNNNYMGDNVTFTAYQGNPMHASSSHYNAIDRNFMTDQGMVPPPPPPHSRPPPPPIPSFVGIEQGVEGNVALTPFHPVQLPVMDPVAVDRSMRTFADFSNHPNAWHLYADIYQQSQVLVNNNLLSPEALRNFMENQNVNFAPIGSTTFSNETQHHQLPGPSSSNAIETAKCLYCQGELSSAPFSQRTCGHYFHWICQSGHDLSLREECYFCDLETNP